MLGFADRNVNLGAEESAAEPPCSVGMCCQPCCQPLQRPREADLDLLGTTFCLICRNYGYSKMSPQVSTWPHPSTDQRNGSEASERTWEHQSQACSLLTSRGQSCIKL